MTRAVLSFGSLNLDGMVNLHTDKALGMKYVPQPEYRLDFTVPTAWPLFYGFGFWSGAAAFAAGQVRTVSANEHDSPNGIGVGVSGLEAQSGSVSFTRYGGGSAAATFNLSFMGGDFLVGSFNLFEAGGTLEELCLGVEWIHWADSRVRPLQLPPARPTGSVTAFQAYSRCQSNQAAYRV